MEYRDLDIGEYQQMAELFETFFGKNFFAVDEKLVDWQHRNSLFRNDFTIEKDSLSAYGAFTEQGQLVACICYIPHRIHIQGSVFKLIESTASICDPQHGGTYPFLLKKLMARTDYYLTFGADDYMKGLFTQVLNFQYIHNVGRSILVIDPKQVYSILLNNKEFVHSAKEIEKIASPVEQDIAYKYVNEFKLKDFYWDYTKSSHTATVDKSVEIIKWKYFNHPHIKYHIISDDDIGSSGIAIMRIEHCMDYFVGRLLEFLPSESSEENLINCIKSFAVDKNLCFVDFICADEVFHDVLEPTFMKSDRHNLFDFPRLFSPLEWRERKSMNCLLGKNSKNHLPELKINEIYLTKGEANQDVMVNQNYISKGV